MGVLAELISDLEVANKSKFYLVPKEMVDKTGKIGGGTALGD